MADDTLTWQINERGEARDYKIFSAYQHTATHAPSGRTGRFTVIDSPNWVNVIALTDEDEVIMVRQFRHGTEAVTLELPGGLVDPDEGFVEAGLRELVEETGFVPESAELLGITEPNPAFMNNRCGLVIARGARPAGAQTLDPNEVIDVVTYPLTEVPALIRSGAITHTLVITAFYFMEHAAESA